MHYSAKNRVFRPLFWGRIANYEFLSFNPIADHIALVPWELCTGIIYDETSAVIDVE